MIVLLYSGLDASMYIVMAVECVFFPKFQLYLIVFLIFLIVCHIVFSCISASYSLSYGAFFPTFLPSSSPTPQFFTHTNLHPTDPLYAHIPRTSSLPSLCCLFGLVTASRHLPLFLFPSLPLFSHPSRPISPHPLTRRDVLTISSRCH